MAAPTPNTSSPISVFTPNSGEQTTDTLLVGSKWGGVVGLGATVFYSFAISRADAFWSQDPAQYGYESAENNTLVALNAVQQSSATAAVNAWANVANITFIKVNETTSAVGDIRMGFTSGGTMDAETYAYAYLPHLTDLGVASPDSGDIWFNTTPPEASANNFTQGAPGFHTMLHELGHALGLNHSFDEDGVGIDDALPFALESHQYTVMSYSDTAVSYDNGAAGFYPTTPMLYDIQAIQYLYGANMSFHAGNDTYVFNGTSKYYQTIWDAGGNDTIQYVSATGGEIDLRAGEFSQLGTPFRVNTSDVFTHFQTENVAIAFNVVIENAIGGSGNDLIIGNTFSNAIQGGAGNDTLIGGVGEDAIEGGAGNDSLVGGADNDYLDGGIGVDTMEGGAGDDVYVVDTLADIVVDNEGLNELRATISYSIASNDAFDNLVLLGTANINATGNSINNLLLGNAGNNILDGGAGNDIMEGGKGNDTYLWRDGGDVFFEASNEGKDTLELASTFGFSAGESATATLFGNIENLDASKVSGVAFDLVGNVLDNLLTGNEADNDFDGQQGNDTLIGGAGNDGFLGGAGVDSLVGGIGNDIYAVNLKTTGLGALAVASLEDIIVESTLSAGGDDSLRLDGTANLTKASTIVLAAGLEHLFSENTLDTKLNLTGNAAVNNIVGNNAANVILGLAGDDTLRGGGGDDTLDGGAGADVLQGGAGNDTYLSELVLLGGLTNVNDTYATDESGIDTIQFSGQVTSATTLELSLTGLSGYENINISATGTTKINLVGNADANVLTGNTANNIIDGGLGADTLLGGAGNDSLVGGADNDYLDGGIGVDTMEGGAGDDVYVVDTLADIVVDNEGLNELRATISYSIASNDAFDNLVLLGTANINATGNSINNLLLGNAGNNILDGGAGADVMAGGDGADTYIVDNTSDTTIESNAVLATGGVDLVKASVTFTLNNNLENLTLTGTGVINATGNTLANTLTGNDSSNFLFGLEGNDTLIGGVGNDFLFGGTGVDNLIGGTGDDRYFVNLKTTGVGALAIASLEDIIVETTLITDGNDTLELENEVILTKASTIVLAAGLENLNAVNTGSTLLNLTGNAAANLIEGNSVANLMSGLAGDDTLLGNAGNDTLDGGVGIDALSGGIGDDTYLIDLVATGLSPNVVVRHQDTVSEFNGTVDGIDTVILRGLFAPTNASLIALTDDLASIEHLDVSLTTTTKLNLTGNESDNKLTGNAANNVIDGGIGSDTLIGGAGNDTYVVDNTGDIVTELLNGGIDTVQSSVDYSLLDTDGAGINGGNVENLTLTGTATIATGNAVANMIIGNTGFNFLIGNGGNDTLDGGAGSGDNLNGGIGNDTYIVDDLTDTITENANEGTDTIQSSVSIGLNFSVYDNIENLTLTGQDNLNGTGSAIANTITGNVGNNQIDGGAGIDLLKGGNGNDTYFVNLVQVGAGATATVKLEDTITENLNEGIDEVNLIGDFSILTAISTLTLGANIENLRLDSISSDTTKLNIIGNTLNNTLTGNSVANRIDGGVGNDVIFGNAGNDSLLGGDGNDDLLGGAGVDNLQGGLGNDRYYIDLVQVGDTVSLQDAVLEVLNAGTDEVNLTAGTFALTNASTLTLGVNLENLNIALAVDTKLNITGNTLNNVLTGNNLANTIDGSTGNDLIFGEAGNDTLIGGIGDDNLNGNEGDDRLLGGAGSDILDGDTGVDHLEGGAGNDTYFLDDANDLTEDVIVEGSAIDSGTDTVKTILTYTLANNSNLENLTLVGSDAVNATGNELKNVVTGNANNNILDGASNIDSLVGGLGDDTYVVDLIQTGATAVTFRVALQDAVTEAINAGSDTLELRGSFIHDNATTLILGANLERFDASNTGSTKLNLTGNTLDNTLTGNVANNILLGSTGNDTLNGGAGNDTLDGGVGIDLLTGGVGDDTYLIDVVASGLSPNVVVNLQDTVVENNSTLDGIDTVILRGIFAPTNASLISLTGDLANIENLDISLTTTTKLNLTGSDTNNLLIGNAVSNIISGGGGNDTLDGGAGNDNLIGGDGDDTLIGGLGVDVFSGGVGNDTYVVDSLAEANAIIDVDGLNTLNIAFTFALTEVSAFANLTLTGVGVLAGTGNSGNNKITGNAAANILNGGLGSDTLDGGASNDKLDGGDGADIMNGGKDADTYIVDNVGDDAVEELTLAQGGGLDVVNSSITFTLGANLDNLVLNGVGNINGIGNSLNNTITGNTANNQLSGLDGNDILDGAAGNDVLEGGNGKDTLNGGIGNDILFGGAESDALIGGLGDDVYHVNLKPFIVGSSFSVAEDVITEALAAGTDKLVLYGESFGYQLNANIENLDLSQLIANQFFTYGNGSNNDINGHATLANLLDGGAGNDTLHGGAGRDHLIGGIGADLLIGGDNSDYYEVDSLSDQIVDDGTFGFDRIVGKISINLNNYSNIEEVELKHGAGNLNATGNVLNNVVSGNDGNNNLDGGAGNDIVYGGFGDDAIIGGLGADMLHGGSGRDTFDFNTFDESGFGSNRDVIFDFSHLAQNKIDFSTIDANDLLVGNQAFTFIGAAAFFGGVAGQLQYVGGNVTESYNNGFSTDTFTGGTLSGDINGDGVADFEIVVIGITSLVSSDFIL